MRSRPWTMAMNVHVVKPVPDLMACESEDIVGARQDYVLQLRPPCLQSGFIIWSLQVFQSLDSLISQIKTMRLQTQNMSFAITWLSLTLWTSAGLESESRLGEDEAVISSAIDDVDCFGHQHVPSISPPHENIVQQLPAPRSRCMHIAFIHVGRRKQVLVSSKRCSVRGSRRRSSLSLQPPRA
ncbi:unnamed protein product [Schistocephalus solidus]|uniref:Secreted protein n=1 Tax=Schistocephalus solidus TaxID=70667 RepID=A0A183SRM0_SCHSO|nr:unnamed protein product [Schistocephalus solidus]